MRPNACRIFFMETQDMFHLIAYEMHMEKKKNAEALETVKRVFDEAGVPYEVRIAKDPDDARRISAEISRLEGEKSIVVLGGDGTLHDVFNGIESFEGLSLGLIPLGTGNDFADFAKIPIKSPEKAARMILAKPAHPIDYIELASGLRSINVVGVGIDVDVLKRAYSAKNRKKNNYFWALISSLIHFKSYNFTLEYEGKTEQHYGILAALGNGRQIGGGIKLFPEAKLDDGWLELLVVDYRSKLRMVGSFINLMLGRVNKVKHATAIRVKAAKFVPEQDSYTIQAEGALYENVVIDAHIVENGVKFYLP